MKDNLSVYQGFDQPVPFDSAVPQLDDTLGELGAWREKDLRRDEDLPESAQHLMAGFQRLFKVTQTAHLAALQDDTDVDHRRILDEVTALRQSFAPREEIQAALRRLARCRHLPQAHPIDEEEVRIEAGLLFDELTRRFHAAHPTRGIYGVAVN